ncbi:OsmC family protein [Risungbinella massiliensis]|uniref:OsmC family protein n=1 Tax=Risungbinella massiliensis TaxID=1329796 RepID=UPI0005CBAF97|nr:OsmC family protein [Risungbinella massiliensis]
MAKHHFHLTAQWSGGRNGEGTISAGNLQTKISIPTPMDGPGTGTNPDEMLIGAAATCYLITLAAMVERGQMAVLDLSLQTEGVVDVTNGKFTFEQIIHRPTVVLDPQASERERKRIERVVYLAEERCMISNAMRGNVELVVVPTYVLGK